MLAMLIVALFVAIALASAAALVDGALRARNALRQLRGDLAGSAAPCRVTVRFAGDPAPLPLPPLRALAISARRRVAQPARAAQPLRAAA